MTDLVAGSPPAAAVQAVLGTLFAAWRGNHHGSRMLMITARVLFILTAAGALLATSDWGFRLVFAAYGAASWMNFVGRNAMTLGAVLWHAFAWIAALSASRLVAALLTMLPVRAVAR